MINSFFLKLPVSLMLLSNILVSGCSEPEIGRDSKPEPYCPSENYHEATMSTALQAVKNMVAKDFPLSSNWAHTFETRPKSGVSIIRNLESKFLGDSLQFVSRSEVSIGSESRYVFGEPQTPVLVWGVYNVGDYDRYPIFKIECSSGEKSVMYRVELCDVGTDEWKVESLNRLQAKGTFADR